MAHFSGESTTPSSETNVASMSFLMSVLLGWGCSKDERRRYQPDTVREWLERLGNFLEQSQLPLVCDTLGAARGERDRSLVERACFGDAPRAPLDIGERGPEERVPRDLEIGRAHV